MFSFGGYFSATKDLILFKIQKERPVMLFLSLCSIQKPSIETLFLLIFLLQVCAYDNILM